MSKSIRRRAVKMSATLVAGTMLSGLVAPSVSLGQSIYTGPNNGNWNVAGNWSLGVPTSTTDARVNNNASNVNVVVNVASSVRALTIDAGDSVSINNGQRLGLFGDVTNNGTITLNATTSFTYLMPSGTVNLNGSGAVVLDDTTGAENAWFYDASNANGVADHLIQGAGHTIRGRGQLGFSGTTQITNNGTINADVSGAILTVEPNASGLSNTGALLATNGGVLNLEGGSNGVFTNSAAAVIQAQGATSIVNLFNNARIVNGTLSGTGTFVVPANQSGRYDSLTHNGSTNVLNGGRLTLLGTVVNNGTITLNATTSFTYLMPSGTVNLNGSGTVVLDDTGGAENAWFYDASNANGVADHLIHGAGHTIRGRGQVGFSGTTQITNNGTINADVSGATLTLEPNASGLSNNSALLATNGGVLNLEGGATGVFTNSAAAVIQAQGPTSIVNMFNNARIVNGTLSGTGTFVVPVNQSGRYDSLTHNGSTNVLNGGRLTLLGTVVNNGTITLNATTSFTYLMPSGTVNLNGSGTVVLDDTGGAENAWFYDASNANGVADHLIHGAGHTIRGRGQLGFSSTTQITNNGTITADVNGAILSIEPNASGFLNNGTLRASNGGILQFTEGQAAALYSGNGPLVVDTGSVIEAAANIGGTLGPVSGSGTLRAIGSGMSLSFQRFNVGTIQATSSGVLRITPGGGNAGTSRVTNAITITSNGRIDIADNGLVFDYTGASPAASVRALLATGRSTGTWFGANGIVSSLANNNGRAIGSAEATELGSPATFLGVSIDSTSFVMRFTLEGDTDLNGSVNFADLVNLARNYGIIGTGTWPKGDFDYNGNVEFADLVAIARNYGLSLSPAESSILGSVGGADFLTDWNLAVAAAVPEPTTLGLLAGVSALSLRRRRSCQ